MPRQLERLCALDPCFAVAQVLFLLWSQGCGLATPPPPATVLILLLAGTGRGWAGLLCVHEPPRLALQQCSLACRGMQQPTPRCRGAVLVLSIHVLRAEAGVRLGWKAQGP